MLNQYPTVFALSLSAALLLALAACAPSETPTDNAAAPVEAPQDTVNQALTQPQSDTRISDQQITEEVTAVLADAVDLSSTIEVDTQAGVVSLYGEVGSEQDRKVLIELISAIDGVQAINTEGLSVAQTS